MPTAPSVSAIAPATPSKALNRVAPTRRERATSAVRGGQRRIETVNGVADRRRAPRIAGGAHDQRAPSTEVPESCGVTCEGTRHRPRVCRATRCARRRPLQRSYTKDHQCPDECACPGGSRSSNSASRMRATRWPPSRGARRLHCRTCVPRESEFPSQQSSRRSRQPDRVRAAHCSSRSDDPRLRARRCRGHHRAEASL